MITGHPELDNAEEFTPYHPTTRNKIAAVTLTVSAFLSVGLILL